MGILVTPSAKEREKLQRRKKKEVKTFDQCGCWCEVR
jgi:hypothetical protein